MQERIAPLARPAAVEPAATDCYEGHAAGIPVPIRIDYRAVRTLRTELAAAGRETIGILLGSFTDSALHIRSGQILGPASDIKEAHAALGEFIKAKLHSAPQEDAQFLGFFRTQAGGWPDVREADRMMTKAYLSSAGTLFLTIQTLSHRSWFATLFLLTGDDQEPPTLALEFPFDEFALRRGFQAEEPVAVPEPEHKVGRSNWRRNLAIALALVVAIIAGGWFIWHSLGAADPSGIDSAATRPLNLQVTRRGSEFTIAWDTRTPLLQRVKDGTLSIRDGDLSKTVDLDADTLRKGSIIYSPTSDEPVFRVQVRDNAGKTFSESVELLRKLPSLPEVAGSVLRGPLAAVRTSPYSAASPSPGPGPGTNQRESGNASNPGVSGGLPGFDKLQTQRTPAAAAPPPPPARPEQISPPAVALTQRAAPPLISAEAPALPPVSAATTPARTAPQPEGTTKAPEPTQSSGTQSSGTQSSAKGVAAPPAPGGGQLRRPKLVYDKQPVYPTAAKIAGAQGKVVIETTVGLDGKIKNMRVTQGNPWLVGAAQEAVRQWRYEPAILDGKPIEFQLTVELNFHLQ